MHITFLIQQEDKNELTCVKYDLTDNLRMTKASDLRGYSTGQLSHMLRRPISIRAEAYLKEIFTLRQDTVVPSIVHDLGKGYNLINDTLLPSCIFKKNLHEESLVQTQFGFMLPQGITLRPLFESTSYMESFANADDYAKHRLSLLSVNMKVDTSLLNMKPRPGFNRMAHENDAKASFLYEQRLFRLELSEWQDEQKASVSQGFVNDVRELPDTFNKDHNKGEFEDFFKTWGHFFVAAGYGGGSVDVKVSTCGLEIGKRSSFFQERMSLENIFKGLSHGSMGYTRFDYYYWNTVVQTLINHCTNSLTKLLSISKLIFFVRNTSIYNSQ